MGLQINRYRSIDDAFRGRMQRLFARGEADMDLTMSASPDAEIEFKAMGLNIRS